MTQLDDRLLSKMSKLEDDDNIKLCRTLVDEEEAEILRED